jgi:hypothetical protein
VYLKNISDCVQNRGDSIGTPLDPPPLFRLDNIFKLRMSFTSLRHIFNKGFGQHTRTYQSLYVYLLKGSNITYIIVYLFSGLSGEARLKQIAQKAKKGNTIKIQNVYIQRLDGLRSKLTK